MKTYEILEKIDKDPSLMIGKRFRKTAGLWSKESGIGDIAVVTEYGNVIHLGAEKYNKIRINVNGFEEWEEVKEPVTFMEAAESGKRIRVEHEYIYDSLRFLKDEYSNLATFLWKLGEEMGSYSVRRVLLEGEFYTED